MPHKFKAAEKWSDKHLLSEGDLLFARSGATVGKTYLHDERFDPAIFAGYCIRFRFNDEVLPEFVYGFTKTDVYASWVGAIQRPAGQPNINKEEFKSLEIPLPPLVIQRRLVAELDAARAERDRSLAEAERLIVTVDELVLSETGIPTDLTTRKVFSVRKSQLRGPLTPEPHAVLPLEKAVDSAKHIADVGQLIRERVTPSKKSPDNLYDWIRIDDLENRPLDVSRVRTEQGKDIGGSLIPVRENDVLVARLGPTLLNAKIVLCPAPLRQMVASPEFLVLRANENWNPTFLRWLLRTNYYRTIMYARSRGGTPSRYRLDASDFLTIPLPMISSSKQKEIAAHCDERVQKAQNLRTHAETVWREAREHFEQQLLQEGKA